MPVSCAQYRRFSTVFCGAVLAALSLSSPAHAAPPSDAPSGAKRYLTGRLPLHEPRSRTTDVQHMELRLKVMPKAKKVSGVVTYTGVARGVAPTLQLHAVDLTLTDVRVQVAGNVITAPAKPDGAILAIPLTGAQPGTAFSVRLAWHTARPAMGLYFIGPDRDAPKRPLHVWTQGETHGIRHWLPSPDDPDERMTWQVQVDVPKGLRVLSNGTPGRAKNQGRRHVAGFSIATPYPLYLFNLAIGPFRAQRHPHKRVKIESWAFPRHQARIRAIGRRTGEMLDLFEKLTGTAYPHTHYGHVYVEEFVAGGMENITLTTLTGRAIGTKRTDRDRTIAGLLAHELAHQWFGDLVTCRTWADLWLNEGFATYYQKQWTLHALGLARFAAEMDGARRASLSADSVTPRPVVTDRYRHPSELFDGHAYPKGAWVLHMLRERLGHTVFDAGIKRYLQGHLHQSVETADLRSAMEQVSGQSLRGYFRRWLRQPGMPRVVAKIRWDRRAKRARVKLTQKQKVDGQRPYFSLPVEIAYAIDGKVKRAVVQLNSKHATWSVTLPHRPDWLMVDPRMKLLAGWKLKADVELMRGAATSAPHPDARLRAVRALRGSVGRDPVIQTLLSVVKTDASRHVRAAAARLLGAAPRESVRGGLQSALRQDKEAVVRRTAAAALGQLQDRASLKLLNKSARKDGSNAVREASLRAIFAIDRNRTRPLLLEAVRWKSWRDRLANSALMLLARLADPRDLSLIWAASESGNSKTLRGGGAVALAAYAARVKAARDPARERLEAMLHEDSPRLRYQAVAALRTLSLPASRRALLAAAAREPSFRRALNMRKTAKGLGSKLPVEARIRSLEKAVRRLQDKIKEGKRGARHAGARNEGHGHRVHGDKGDAHQSRKSGSKGDAKRGAKRGAGGQP